MIKKLSKSPTSSPTAASVPLPPSRPATATTTTTASPAPILSTLTDLQPLPRLIVFDLDYTLWPFWVDTHVTPPLKALSSHQTIHDKFAEPFALYPDVAGILFSLRAAGVKIAAASRTHAPELAREMLKLLHIPPLRVPNEVTGAGSWRGGNASGIGSGKARKALEYFDHLEVYPGSKITHFEKIRRASGVDYDDVLFFDDESRNRDVERLGVTMWLVRDGVTRGEIDEGIREWRRRRDSGLGLFGSKTKEES